MSDPVDALSPAGVSELATFIIRPPRAQYSRADLGDKAFSVDATPAVRTDTTVYNERGHRLQASHFRALRTPPDAPTVVYLHGNGSCRVEATTLLPLTIPYGLALFAFDFSGSGRSDGEFISLGVWERFDVAAVVNYLVSLGVRSIVLWGHSMGAATAIMFVGLCQRRIEVKGLVLDSPFASFDRLAQSMVAEMPIPIGVPRKLVLTVGVRAVRKIVRERAGFDVFDIDPLSAIRKVHESVPAMFIHGSADAVVPLSHGELLFKNYPGDDKEWLMLKDYEHDTPRPDRAMDRAHIFLQKTLGEDNVGSFSYLEILKGRGNVAMLSGRFVDSIYLYTEALNALSESLTNLCFADAVGEITEEEEGENIIRRNSSITNFVTNVKRWRSRYSQDELHHTSRAHLGAEGRHLSASNTENCTTNDTSQVGCTAECARSDSSAWSGRFARQRSWRRPGFVDAIKRCVRPEPANADALPVDAMNSDGRHHRRSSRSSRASGRARLRHRAQRRSSVDRKGRRRTEGGPFKSRYSSTEGILPMRRRRTEENIAGRSGYGVSGLGICDWDLDVERKGVALALLGNRSLARRKIGDVEGALFDAGASLQLDASWVRGYLRKAAALREIGRLELAREVVMEGMRREPQHAGLTDLLRSIDVAVKAEQGSSDEMDVGFEAGAIVGSV